MGCLLHLYRTCPRGAWTGRCDLLTLVWHGVQGLDITKLASTGHFAFVDGLASLATSPREASALDAISKDISLAISKLSSPASREKNITLILDQPDALLATAAASTSALNHALLTLRSKVHSAVVTLSADLPLVSAAAPSLVRDGERKQPTPLETETAAFLVQQAHAARFVMSVRELDTGAARDVSGVVRVTRGGDADGVAEARDAGAEDGVREMEALFVVGRDGGAKVIERGSAG